MPTISIAIAVYNRQSYLAAAIESVLAQSYQDFELLIWDDGSTDSSLKIAQHYATLDARVRVVAALHQGFTPSLKSAFALSSGTYIGWVDSDDLLAPTALEQTTAVLDSQPQVGLVYTNHRLINGVNEVLGPGWRCSIPYSKNRLLVDFMVFHFRLMRRSLFEQVGGIDAAVELVPDYDLCLRLSEVTEFHHLPRSLYDYRIHPQSMSQQQQLETIRNSQAAVERALQRRELADRYELQVKLLQQEGELMSQFALRKKQVSNGVNVMPTASDR